MIKEIPIKASPLVSVRQAFFIVSVIALLLYPLIFIGNYAGDSQVHLVYGQNAARGDFFEFNPGEKSPGVTSPGFMLFLGALFKMAPDSMVPAIVKGANLLFWYGLSIVIFLIARRLLSSDIWAMVATLAAGLLPGSVYNSTIGMENGIFAFFVLLWFYVAIRARWFTAYRDEMPILRSELGLGLLLGVSCWLRPEGFVVAAVALIFRGFLEIRSRPALVSVLSRSLVFLVPFVALTGGLAYFHLSQTGHLLPTSGVSRILMSNIDSDTLQVGPVFLSSKFALRLAAYFPLTILWLIGSWLVFSGRVVRWESTEAVKFLIVLFWTAFILYTAVLGSTHLARYIVYVMPALVLVGMMGGKWLWDFWSPPLRLRLSYVRTFLAIAFVVSLSGVYAVETDLRLGLDSQASLWKSMRAPAELASFSEELFNELGQPEALPISVALQEVQARYWLDERFVVRSLDGRVDPVLLEYAGRDNVDHVGYLKERKVNFLLSDLSYNRDSERWSLENLRQLDAGESLSREGLKFTRLTTDRDAISKENTEGYRSWRWFAGTDGPTVLQWFLWTVVRVEPQG